jgi:hypothetical protein
MDDDVLGQGQPFEDHPALFDYLFRPPWFADDSPQPPERPEAQEVA